MIEHIIDAIDEAVDTVGSFNLSRDARTRIARIIEDEMAQVLLSSLDDPKEDSHPF